MRGHRATRAPFGASATAPVTPPGTDVRLEGVSAVVRTAARAESRSPPGDDDASSSAMASTSAASAGARLSPEGDLELSARAKRELQRHLRRVHARINDSAQAKEASRRCASTSASVASAPSARSRGNPEDSPRHLKRTRWAGTIATRFDRLPRARSPRGFVGARRTPPPRSPRRRDDTRVSRRRGRTPTPTPTTEDDDRREGEADRIDRRSRRSRRATRGRSSRRRGDVLRRRRRRGPASCAISRARESERRREDAHEKPHGDEEPPSVRLEMTMAGRRRLSRLGRW